MTDSRDESKVAPWTRSRVAVRLLILALPLLALDVAFWFKADFTKFVPPCDGPISERLYFAGVTASGPLVMCAINGWGAAGWGTAGGAAFFFVALLAPAFASPQSSAARWAGYFAVGLWFFVGFVGASLRIT